jgi:hypothetical protein
MSWLRWTMSWAVRWGGEFRLVLLQGEAGTGKSRLGRELLRRHREVTGLTAQGYPLAASAAFGLWTEAMDPASNDLPDLPDADVVGVGARLLPGLQDPRSARPARMGRRRSRVRGLHRRIVRPAGAWQFTPTRRQVIRKG